MTFYNPRIYNYANLKKEDKLMVRGMIAMIKDIDDLCDDDEPSTIFEKMHAGIKKEVVNDIKEDMCHSIIDQIVACIESYDDDDEVQEFDTFDYFYGWDGNYGI